MRRPPDHRLEDRVHARPLAAHWLWRHHRSFVRDVEEHLFPGELRVRKSLWALARLIVEHVWLGRVVEADVIYGLRLLPRHLWGDFREERRQHANARADAAFEVGRSFGRDEVYHILERKLVDQEFPIR